MGVIIVFSENTFRSSNTDRTSEMPWFIISKSKKGGLKWSMQFVNVPLFPRGLILVASRRLGHWATNQLNVLWGPTNGHIFHCPLLHYKFYGRLSRPFYKHFFSYTESLHFGVQKIVKSHWHCAIVTWFNEIISNFWLYVVEFYMVKS